MSEMQKIRDLRKKREQMESTLGNK